MGAICLGLWKSLPGNCCSCLVETPGSVEGAAVSGMQEMHPWGRARTQRRGERGVLTTNNRGASPGCRGAPKGGNGSSTHPCATGAALWQLQGSCRSSSAAPHLTLRGSQSPPGLSEPNQGREVVAEKQRVGEDRETTLPWLRGDYLITALQMHGESPFNSDPGNLCLGLALLL